MSDSSRTDVTDDRSQPTLHDRCAALVDDSPYASARTEAEELGGRSPDPLTAEVLRMIARMVGARSSVCIATAPGVAALALLDAGGPGATVTCITDDPHHLDVARQALRGSGHPASAARFISARPLEVVDKLADSAYDLVVAEVPAGSVGRLCARAHLLLRSGGALVLSGEHAPLPEDAELPEQAHVAVLPVGVGLTVITC